MELYYAYLRLLIAFPLVILLAYFGLRLFLSRFSPSMGGGKRVKVLERTALNSKSYIYLVKVGNQYLLLASTASTVTLLKDLGEVCEEELYINEEFQGTGEAVPPNFATVMEEVKKRVKGKGNPFSNFWHRLFPIKRDKE